MAKKHGVVSYTDEQIAEEIVKIRGQVDMMEHLLEIYEERYYNGQRNFSILPQMQAETPPVVVLSWRKRIVRKGYRIAKKALEAMHLAEPLKKTTLYRNLANDGIIYKMATGSK